MSLITGNNLAGGQEAEELAGEIAKSLGIKHCKKLVITMERGKIFTVEATYYPEVNGIRGIVPIFKKFQLSLIAVNNSVLGDEFDRFEFVNGKEIKESEGEN